MTLEEYQTQAGTTMLPSAKSDEYLGLGLLSEAGEVAAILKRHLRDGVLIDCALAFELGDVLWYVAMLAQHHGISLEDLAAANLAKLADRKRTNTLQGKGDYR